MERGKLCWGVYKATETEVMVALPGWGVITRPGVGCYSFGYVQLLFSPMG